MRRFAPFLLLSLAHGQSPDSIIVPIIVNETTLNDKLPSTSIEEFANNHIETIKPTQVVSEFWQTKLDETASVALPEKLDPLAPPTFEDGVGTEPTNGEEQQDGGFDISQLTKYDTAVSSNRNALSMNKNNQLEIETRLNDTMLLLAPLRKSANELEAKEMKLRKKLQLLKLKAKHDVILAERKKLKEDEENRLIEEADMEAKKQDHEKHLAAIKLHLATLNGELVENTKEEGQMESVDKNENQNDGDEEQKEKKDDSMLSQAKEESAKDELAVEAAKAMDNEMGLTGATGSSTGGTGSATGTASEETGSATGVMEEMNQNAAADVDEEKTDIETEVDMDTENLKVEKEENGADDVMLDKIALRDEETKERLDSEDGVEKTEIKLKKDDESKAAESEEVEASEENEADEEVEKSFA